MFNLLTESSVTFFKLLVQGGLEETDQSDLVLDPGPGGRSQLLTDRDPLLGGLQGLCDTAGKINIHIGHCVYPEYSTLCVSRVQYTTQCTRVLQVVFQMQLCVTLHLWFLISYLYFFHTSLVFSYF